MDQPVTRTSVGFKSHDGKTQIKGLVWCPERVKAGGCATSPVGIVQIVHGMSEHVGRYDDFARFLAAQGYVVCAHDHVGHGKSVSDPKEWGCLPVEGGKDILIDDVHELRKTVAARYARQTPYFLFGHSMGSFVTRAYLARHAEGLAGAVLCGTGNQSRALSKAGNLLARRIAASKGEDTRSDRLDGMGAGAFSKQIENPRTPFDWLSTDPAVVDAYIEDEMCGAMFSAGGYATLTDLTGEVASPSCAAKVPKDLPVLFVSGAEDPVGSLRQGRPGRRRPPPACRRERRGGEALRGHAPRDPERAGTRPGVRRRLGLDTEASGLGARNAKAAGRNACPSQTRKGQARVGRRLGSSSDHMRGGRGKDISMHNQYVIALDQGTTSSRAMLIDAQGRAVSSVQRPFPQIYPHPGWVEHNPQDILSSQLGALTELLVSNSLTPADIDSIGITNQRETTVVWNRETGEPVFNAIVWQCRRTAPHHRESSPPTRTSCAPSARRRGSCPTRTSRRARCKWILDNVPGAREQRGEGRSCAFGTVDSWLVWTLTYGQVHATDATNAEPHHALQHPRAALGSMAARPLRHPRVRCMPEVRPVGRRLRTHRQSRHRAGCAHLRRWPATSRRRCSGSAASTPGEAKNTYGTGCFLLMHTGHEACRVDSTTWSPPLPHRLRAWPPNTRLRAACSWPGRWCSGCATSWAWWTTAAETEAVAKSVPDSGRRLRGAGVHRAGRAVLGRGQRAAPSTGSRAAPPGRTWCAPRWSRSRTR